MAACQRLLDSRAGKNSGPTSAALLYAYSYVHVHVPLHVHVHVHMHMHVHVHVYVYMYKSACTLRGMNPSIHPSIRARGNRIL